MEVIRRGTLEYIMSPGIGVPHCFTTRLGGVSQGYLSSLNLGNHRGDDPENVAKNYAILGNTLGFYPKNLVLSHQVHTDTVRPVTKADAQGFDHHAYPECDALVTCDPGTALGIFTADCTPILFWDPVTGAVGAAHAGWRGTALNIVGKTVAAMAAHFGSRPADIRAAIGPNIGPCCFQTDGEVPAAMEAALGSAAWEFIQAKEDKYYVNLKGLNARFLQDAGVMHIDISQDCTACQSHRFWSHRVTRGNRGAQGAIIVCKEAAL